MGNRQQGDRRRQQERLGPRRSRHQRVLETRWQDRRTARRQGIGKSAGRGAIARRKEGGRSPQAKRDQEIGSAQDVAEEVAFREPCFRRHAWYFLSSPRKRGPITTDVRSGHSCGASLEQHGQWWLWVPARASLGLDDVDLDCFAPRNDGALISNATPRSRGAMCPSFARPFAQKSEGVGNAGCAMHPQPRV
jgi:hypothetical protein